MPARRWLAPWIVGILVGAVACASGELPAPDPMSELMWRHFGGVETMRLAAVRGDLDVFRSAAERLRREAAGEALPASPSLARMRALAAEAVGAPDLEAAGRLTGALGGACGSCHRTAGAGPESGAGRAPPGLATRPMARHLWAVNRMWAGLVAPSEESWRAGAGVLASVPLEPDRVTVAVTAEVERLAERVHGLGERAEAAAAGPSRAALYGELLATCAGCHAAVEGAGR